MTKMDEFVDELQRHLDEQTYAKYGKAAVERWRNPPHQGKPSGTNCQGASTGKCGDTIQIFLHIENDRVRSAGFLTDGCGSSVISGSMAAELALNKWCDDLTTITGETVRDSLDGLLKEDEHCAWLAANALHDAVGDYFKHTIHANEKDGEQRFSTEKP